MLISKTVYMQPKRTTKTELQLHACTCIVLYCIVSYRIVSYRILNS